MDIASSLHQDSIHEVTKLNPETPRQEPQKTCTRNSPCLQQRCMICSTPINQTRNLDVALNGSNALPTSPTTTDLSCSSLPSSNIDFILYKFTKLWSTRQTATDLLNLHIAASTPSPASPPNGQVPAQSTPPPSVSFKPPKLVTDNWSGQSYDFYPWLSSVLNGFTLTRCDNPAKLVLTPQAIPLNKRGSFNNITNWPSFKNRLIEEFGSIDIFGRDANQIFDLLSCFESVQEVAEDLSAKIKTLQADLEIIQQFHDVEDLHSATSTQSLVQNIMRSLPMEVRSSFNDQFMEFRGKDPANVRPPATFLFLAKYVNKLEKNYRSNPSLFYLDRQP